MRNFLTILPYVEVLLAVVLVAGILLQRRGASSGSAFGGGDGTIYGERRGAEKTFFTITVVVGILFVTVALIQFILK